MICSAWFDESNPMSFSVASWATEGAGCRIFFCCLFLSPERVKGILVVSFPWAVGRFRGGLELICLCFCQFIRACGGICFSGDIDQSPHGGGLFRDLKPKLRRIRADLCHRGGLFLRKVESVHVTGSTPKTAR